MRIKTYQKKLVKLEKLRGKFLIQLFKTLEKYQSKNCLDSEELGVLKKIYSDYKFAVSMSESIKKNLELNAMIKNKMSGLRLGMNSIRRMQ